MHVYAGIGGAEPTGHLCSALHDPWIRGQGMDHNIGELDQVVRIFIGVAIIVTGIYFKSWLALIGFAPLVTAITGSCPLYTLTGISTQQPTEEAR